MFLSDADIKREIEAGNLIVKPFEEKNLQSASLDLRLATDFLVPDHYQGRAFLSLDEEPDYVERDGDKIIIPPKAFVLGRTLEYIKIPDNMVAHVEGRSSIGRIGLFIQNAGWVDPGFEGDLTLELFNGYDLPIVVESGRRICQLTFGYLKTPAKNPYHGKYKGQSGTTGSRIHLDKEVNQ